MSERRASHDIHCAPLNSRARSRSKSSVGWWAKEWSGESPENFWDSTVTWKVVLHVEFSSWWNFGCAWHTKSAFRKDYYLDLGWHFRLILFSSDYCWDCCWCCWAWLRLASTDSANWNLCWFPTSAFDSLALAMNSRDLVRLSRTIALHLRRGRAFWWRLFGLGGGRGMSKSFPWWWLRSVDPVNWNWIYKISTQLKFSVFHERENKLNYWTWEQQIEQLKIILTFWLLWLITRWSVLRTITTRDSDPQSWFDPALLSRVMSFAVGRIGLQRRKQREKLWAFLRHQLLFSLFFDLFLSLANIFFSSLSSDSTRPKVKAAAIFSY